MLTEKLGFSLRLAQVSRGRLIRRATMVDPGSSHHTVPADAGDTPILAAAVAAGADYLVTNDRHLLALNPYEGLRIVSMAHYHQILVNEGLIQPGS